MKKKPVLEIDKPHFIVKLHEDTLEVDLKEGAKKELEDVVEAHPIVRESLGILFQTMIPLDIALKDVDSAVVDDNGQLKIVIPFRRDITIPLKVDEAERLAKKLNRLIPLAKLKDAEHMKALDELEERPRPKTREPS
ncbi:MAG: hypothetical protein OEZ48_18065 [Candidatus Bathyarchaeota archaeon]|nr:hypothetical protein [Candidatus Bathyarchaeota archaeon]MDH5689760.1 hypothetical protein [Candidatus Bathyarchaeota archaeon]